MNKLLVTIATIKIVSISTCLSLCWLAVMLCRYQQQSPFWWNNIDYLTQHNKPQNTGRNSYIFAKPRPYVVAYWYLILWENIFKSRNGKYEARWWFWFRNGRRQKIQRWRRSQIWDESSCSKQGKCGLASYSFKILKYSPIKIVMLL